jgi:Holliday junction DNA helicase RuvA
MIGTLRGSVTEKYGDTIIIDIAGVGYELTVTASDWGSSGVGHEAKFYIYEQIREDMHNLYGFASIESKQLFTLMLSVSGVGPKVAMAVLSAASIDRLRQAIAAGDPDLLRGVSGVGKKTAERLILELRGKLDGGVGGLAPVMDETYQALIALGYTPGQATAAIGQIPDSITGEQERIKAALKGLSS